MTDKTQSRACPNCGAAAHIYGRADIRWMPNESRWEIGDAEDGLECTQCDEAFYASDVGLPPPSEAIDGPAATLAETVDPAVAVGLADGMLQWSTGGGCQALGVQIGDYRIMLTDEQGLDLPVGDDWLVGVNSECSTELLFRPTDPHEGRAIDYLPRAIEAAKLAAERMAATEILVKATARGFQLVNTGGNCMAHRLDVDPCNVLLTDGQGEPVDGADWFLMVENDDGDSVLEFQSSDCPNDKGALEFFEASLSAAIEKAETLAIEDAMRKRGEPIN